MEVPKQRARVRGLPGVSPQSNSLRPCRSLRLGEIGWVRKTDPLRAIHFSDILVDMVRSCRF